MKIFILVISLVSIIGIDCGLIGQDEINSCEISIEWGTESSESESNESSENNLKDYIKSNAQQVVILQVGQLSSCLSSHLHKYLYHNHWDEIPYPPPESC